MNRLFSTVKLVSLYSFCALALMGCKKDIDSRTWICRSFAENTGAPYVNGKIHMRNSSVADDPGMRIVDFKGNSYKPVSSLQEIKGLLRELRDKYSHGEIFDIGFTGEAITVRCPGNNPDNATCPAMRLTMLNVWERDYLPRGWACY